MPYSQKTSFDTEFRWRRKSSPGEPSFGGFDTCSFRGLLLPTESRQRTKSTLAKRSLVVSMSKCSSSHLLVPAKLILPPPERRKVIEWAGWEREEE